MNLADEQTLDCSVDQAWQLLNDPEILQACIPGCETLEVSGPNAYSAIAVVKIGPIKARFSGNVELTDLRPPYSCRITGKGNGGVAGFAEGGADVELAEVEEGKTLLTYRVDAKVGGKIAQLGGRLIDSTAKKLAAQFFGNLQKYVAEMDGDTDRASSASEG